MKRVFLIWLIFVISFEVSIQASLIQEKIVIEFIENMDVKTCGDINYLSKYLDEDVTARWMMHKNSGMRKGLEEMKDHFSKCWKMTPDGKKKVSNIFSKGNDIFVEGFFNGTRPNGEKYKVPFMSRYLMKVDKIKDIVTYADYGGCNK